MKPIALFDLDGTLADYDGAMTRDLEAIAGPSDLPIGPSTSCPPRMGTGRPQWLENRRLLVTRQPGWFRNLARYEPGFVVLNAAVAVGFAPHVLTKGPRGNHGAWTQKVEWCAEHLPDVPVHVVTNKELSYGRVLVDDWPPYVEAWLAHRPRGLAVVPAHSWNEGLAGPNIVRFDAHNFGEMRERLVHAFTRKDGEL